MSPASAVGSDPTRPCPTSRGHGRFFFVSGGAVRAQTAAGPRAGACRLRHFWGTFPQKGIPKGLVPWAGAGRARRSPRGMAGEKRCRGRGGAMDFAPFMSAGKGGYAVPSTEKGRKGFAFPGAPAKPPDGQCAWGNRFFPRHTHIRRAALQRLCPHGANSVEYAHSQRPLPAKGKAASFSRPAWPFLT